MSRWESVSTFRHFRKRAASSIGLLVLLVVALSFTAGCGDSQEDFVFIGSGGEAVGAADTGSLVFNFTRAQASTEVPRETQRLRFQFLDSVKNVVLSREVPFATQVTIEQVPLTAVSVRITALSEGRFPLGVIDDAVGELQAGTTQVVNLADASAAPVTFDTLVVSPKPVTLGVDGSRTLTLNAGFSNGERVIVPATAAGLQFATTNENVATVGANGTITGVAPGSATVTASWTFNGVTRSDSTAVTVSQNEEVAFVELVSRASTSLGGALANEGGVGSGISSDGRYVTFDSSATNLVPGVGGVGLMQTYVYDRQSQTVELVSKQSGSEGEPANNFGVYGSTISSNGRYVTFASDATNLVTGVAGPHIYIYDRQTLTVDLISKQSGLDGVPANGTGFSAGGHQFSAVSADGRYVAFASNATNLFPGASGFQVYVYDRQTLTVELVSRQSGADGEPAGGGPDGWNEVHGISADGRYVAFRSDADNLVPGVGGAYPLLYVYDRQAQSVELVSKQSGPDGEPAYNVLNVLGGNISADGRYVAFGSDAPNLVPGIPEVSPGVTVPQAYVYDRQTQTLELVSKQSGPDGEPANTTTTPVVGFGPAFISADGRYATFQSNATNLIPGVTGVQVYVYDRQTDTVRLASRLSGSDGSPSDGDSTVPKISADGGYVMFTSGATNLTPEATSNIHVYVTNNHLRP